MRGQTVQTDWAGLQFRQTATGVVYGADLPLRCPVPVPSEVAVAFPALLALRRRSKARRSPGLVARTHTFDTACSSAAAAAAAAAARRRPSTALWLSGCRRRRPGATGLRAPLAASAVASLAGRWPWVSEWLSGMSCAKPAYASPTLTSSSCVRPQWWQWRVGAYGRSAARRSSVVAHSRRAPGAHIGKPLQLPRPQACRVTMVSLRSEERMM
eukprot:scaffold15170_cov69-Phaeocystis_antarctica.AAC.1